jgi:hypothetical protein
LGGFDERLVHLDDWDMWIRLSAAERGAACPEVLVAYRRHRRNRALGNRDSLRPGLAYLVRKHRALAAEHGVRFDEAAFARWIAFCQRRAGRPLRAARTCLDSAWKQRNPADLARGALVLVGPWAAWHWRPQAPPATPAWLEPYQASQVTAESSSPTSVSAADRPLAD